GPDTWGQSFSIDPWGNLTAQTTTKGNPPGFSNAALANNQLAGYCYDAAGNLLKEAVCPIDLTTTPYQWDGENRLKGFSTSSYTYDANGMRIKKTDGTTA